MQEKNKIKWDDIIYPEQEEKSVIITLLEKFTRIKK